MTYRSRFNTLPLLSKVLSIYMVSMGCGGTTGELLDTSGYTIEAIDGSDYQIARKFEGDHLLEEGLLQKGRKEGTWIQYHPKRKGHVEQVAHYASGKLHGAMLTFDPKGNLIKMNQFAHGLEHGQSIQYNNGKVADISPFKYGLLDGTFESFYGNEKIQQQIEYQKGKKEGALRYFDEAGNVTVEYRYQNDEKVDGGMINPEQ